MLCLCGQIHIGTTKHSVAMWLEKLALAEHEHAYSNEGHAILFEEFQTLASSQRYSTHMYRQAIERF